MMTGGLNPSRLGGTTRYFPSLVGVTMGIGLTLLYKIAVSVKSEMA